LPVRILLDPRELEAHPLRVGLSTAVRVDLHDASGPLVTTAVRNVSQPTQASAGNDPAVDARIAAIVADNAGPRAHEPARLSRQELERQKLEAAASGVPLVAAGR
jgi:membrane fusion protein (multidrug efflux system)